MPDQSFNSSESAADPNSQDPHAELRSLLKRLWMPLSRPWFRLNMVLTSKNQIVGPDGSSKSISSVNDRVLLGVIRGYSDAILVGATTSRNELIASEKSKPILVLTSSGDVDLGRLSPGSRIVAPVGSKAAEMPNAITFLATANPTESSQNLRNTLLELGFENVVCEGGAETAMWLIQSGFFDELAITRSPKVGAGQSYDFGLENWDIGLDLPDPEGFHYQRLTPKQQID